MDSINSTLNFKEAANNAQFYSSIMFPILGNISYVNYAITAAVGGYLVIINAMDIGGLASFLQFSRTFAQPLGQMSQQMNVLLSAMAGAERIFAILREKPEVDEGTVTLDQRIQNNGTGWMVRNVFQLLETSNYTMLTLAMCQVCVS